ncbi:hypothetical protein CN373_04780 [Bacillus cereus]|uniref:DUF11 domain-containing protein n=2 Tax=Bacillus TaxID=1386 RepID=A0AA44TGM7_BACCE|nr:hypothetical protein bcere0022_31470 [Bacillus cereus Rock3-44]PFA24346.1 hypothetical protein CN373_04780 [Bacillus cereus]PFN09705.1 hypothetical protein COJ55_02285 [Bacillus cereus]PFO81683.1 hypothetical protein COJ77_15490 [Bacillus cereus]PFR23198.1 hypothetical protein COK19_20660 [Bacillus cereus]
MWEISLDKEWFPLSLQPVIWMEGSSKAVTNKQSNPNLEVTLQIRSQKEKDFSEKVVYGVHEILFIQLEVENIGNEEVSHIIVSHMIRDHFAYIPNTLHANKGTGEFLFQLVRWRIDELRSGEKAQLICQVKATRIQIPSSISLRATYTFQQNGRLYGPLQTKEVILIQ